MTESTPRMLLIGATGPTGRAILAKAASVRWAMRAMARKPEALADFVSEHEIVPGDVLATSSLEPAMSGLDGVVCVLGTPLILTKTVTLLSEGAKNIVAAMRRAGVGRLICITGVGAGDSRGHGGFLYDQILLPLILGRIYADKDRQEAIVRASGLDWLLVRPAVLTNGPETGRYRALAELAGQRLTRISRKDVADFIVGEAREPIRVRTTVNLTD